MSDASSVPPGAVAGFRIATPPTWPVWRGVSSARNWASRLVSCLIARDSPLAEARQSQVPQQRRPARGHTPGRERDVPDATLADAVDELVPVTGAPGPDV